MKGLLALALLTERLDDILALRIHISPLVFVDCDSSALFIQRFFNHGKSTVCKLLLSEEHAKNMKLFFNKKEDFIF